MRRSRTGWVGLVARLCSTIQYNCHELPDITEPMVAVRPDPSGMHAHQWHTLPRCAKSSSCREHESMGDESGLGRLRCAQRKVQSNAAGVGLFPAACRFNHSCE